MSTELTFRVVSTPDVAAGEKPTVVLDVSTTVTLNDAVAKMMLAAQIERFTVRARPGFGRVINPLLGQPLQDFVPKPDEAVTMAVQRFVAELTGSADTHARNLVTQAALQQAVIPEAKPDKVDTKVDVAMDTAPADVIIPTPPAKPAKAKA